MQASGSPVSGDDVDITEQLYVEAHHRAGCPEGMRAVLMLVMEERERTLPPIFYTLDEIVGAFSDIELRAESVDDMYIHPDDVHDFIHMLLPKWPVPTGGHGGWAFANGAPEEMTEYTELYGTGRVIQHVEVLSDVVGYMWGATIHRDDSIVRKLHHRIRLNSRSYTVWI